MKAHLLSLVVTFGLFGCGDMGGLLSSKEKPKTLEEMLTFNNIQTDVTFKVDKLDAFSLVEGLPLVRIEKRKSEDDEKIRWHWKIQGVKNGYIEVVGDTPDNVSEITGRCMDSGEDRWPEDGVCFKVFVQLADRLLTSKAGAYELIKQSGLNPRIKNLPQANIDRGTMFIGLDNNGYFGVRKFNK